jgi:N-acetylmuramoyl-L-alanine amidase
VWLASGDRGEAVTWTLAIGHLDPIEELSGVQGRLANLSYFCGASDGQPSAELDSALARFRHDEQLGEGSDLDDATRSRLRKRHDNL